MIEHPNKPETGDEFETEKIKCPEKVWVQKFGS
jgi:hypothetical protein